MTELFRKKIIQKTNASLNKEFEECVLCHKITAVRIGTIIEMREHYVKGVGQLCVKCYQEVYCQKTV